MKTIEVGDIVQNGKGWQGRILQVSQGRRFGRQCLVEYASRREWESEATLYRVAKGQKNDPQKNQA